MKFNELKECPFCGCGEFYTTEYVYGTLRYRERFDGTEAHNEQLYDGLNTKNIVAELTVKIAVSILGIVRKITCLNQLRMH